MEFERFSLFLKHTKVKEFTLSLGHEMGHPLRPT